MAGHDFASADEFRQLIKTLVGRLELEVESHGQMRKVTLDLPPEAPPPPAGNSETSGAETSTP